MNNRLLSYYIVNNDIISTCNLPSPKVSAGNIYYEVMRVIDGKPLFFEDHLSRFFNSVNISGNTTVLTKKTISLRIKALIETNNLSEGNIRFQCSFSGKETFSAWVAPFFYPGKELYNSGITLLTMNIERSEPNMKMFNADYKSTVDKFIANNSCYEALLTTNNGMITEGSKSNVFFINNNSVITPPNDKILPGITRQKVIGLCRDNDIIIEEKQVHINDLKDFNGAFITGTSPKILPVSVINRVGYNPENKITQHLINIYNNIIHDYIKNFTWANSQ